MCGPESCDLGVHGLCLRTQVYRLLKDRPIQPDDIVPADVEIEILELEAERVAIVADAERVRRLEGGAVGFDDEHRTKGGVARHVDLQEVAGGVNEGRGCADLARVRDRARVRVAGMVVARQRPATAKGVTFMLLEDEHGPINLIVPPPVYERCRLAVRAEPIVEADGRLERREGVTNVLVSAVRRLDRPDLPLGEVRHIEPRRIWSTDEDAGDLRAVLPTAHSFGRRG